MPAERVRSDRSVRACCCRPAGVLLLALFILPVPALVTGSLSILGYMGAVLRPLMPVGGRLAGLRVAHRRLFVRVACPVVMSRQRRSRFAFPAV